MNEIMIHDLIPGDLILVCVWFSEPDVWRVSEDDLFREPNAVLTVLSVNLLSTFLGQLESYSSSSTGLSSYYVCETIELRAVRIHKNARVKKI